MTRLSSATAEDFAPLAWDRRDAGDFFSAQDAAQAFVDELFERFRESLVLLRLFTTVPFCRLSERDQDLVRAKAGQAGAASALRDQTPVLALLGTRGSQATWNDREGSERFRCIPLLSTAYVRSLSMLSLHFQSVGFDLDLVDRWADELSAPGRAASFRGTLHIPDAATDRDPQGRMAVPAQDFVAKHGVKTAFGFGAGYARAPALVALFAFAGERVDLPRAGPIPGLLDGYLRATEGLVERGAIFSRRAD